MIQFKAKPKYLYKYCSANRAVQILRDKYLYLTPISKLNDLYEFAFHSLFSMQEDTLEKYMVKNIKTLGVNLPNKDVNEIVKKSSRADLEDSFSVWKENLTHTFNSIREHSGVTCFSEESNNQRMWGTYGDYHKGACIEFKTFEKESPFDGILLPVFYTNSKLNMCYSEIIDEDGSLNINVLTFLSSIKHTHWRDEKEWRALMLANTYQDDEARKLRFRDTDISRVFLGPLMPEEQEKDIIEAKENSGLSLGVFKRVVDGMFGKEHLEGFEFPKSSAEIKYWIERQIT